MRSEATRYSDLMWNLENITDKATRVIEKWDSGNLAQAVRELSYARREARRAIAQVRLTFAPT